MAHRSCRRQHERRSAPGPEGEPATLTGVRRHIANRESGNLGGAADTLDTIAYIQSQLKNLAEATIYYELALEAYRELGEGGQQSPGWRHVIAVVLSGLAAVTDALSDALNRASYGL